MKKSIQLIVFLLIGFNGFSKCASTGLEFWPNKSNINENSIFLIEGYAKSQEIIHGLGKAYNVYLQSGNQKIKLNVQEVLIGQFNLTQAVLKPEILLSAGKEYELIIENLGDLQAQVTKYDPKSKKRVKIKWTVTEGKDDASPTWNDMPKFKNHISHELGCGPETVATFTFSASDNSEYLIKTTVTNSATGKSATYYLQATDNLIAVGHGMCSGAFKFVGSEQFEVQFSLYDSAGNQTKLESDKIQFTMPKA